jgi:hypothetical protein
MAHKEDDEDEEKEEYQGKVAGVLLFSVFTWCWDRDNWQLDITSFLFPASCMTSSDDEPGGS